MNGDYGKNHARHIHEDTESLQTENIRRDNNKKEEKNRMILLFFPIERTFVCACHQFVCTVYASM